MFSLLTKLLSWMHLPLVYFTIFNLLNRTSFSVNLAASAFEISHIFNFFFFFKSINKFDEPKRRPLVMDTTARRHQQSKVLMSVCQAKAYLYIYSLHWLSRTHEDAFVGYFVYKMALSKTHFMLSKLPVCIHNSILRTLSMKKFLNLPFHREQS